MADTTYSADSSAAAMAECLGTPSTPNAPGGPSGRKTGPDNKAVGNDPYSCVKDCPDGTQYPITVAANTLFAATKGNANRLAQMNCKRRMELQECPPYVAPDVSTIDKCQGQTVDLTFTMRGLTTVNNFVVDSVPPGMTSSTNGNTIVMTGVPTLCAAGVGWVAQVAEENKTDPSIRTTRSVIVNTFKIDQTGALPNAVKGSGYSTFLTYSGNFTEPHEWLIDSFIGDSLPDGLNLDDQTGEISGTPTELGEFTLFVKLSSSLGQCLEILTLEVVQTIATEGPGAVNCGPYTVVYLWMSPDGSTGWTRIPNAFASFGIAPGDDIDPNHVYWLNIGHYPAFFGLHWGALTIDQAVPHAGNTVWKANLDTQTGLATCFPQ